MGILNKIYEEMACMTQLWLLAGLMVVSKRLIQKRTTFGPLEAELCDQSCLTSEHPRLPVSNFIWIGPEKVIVPVNKCVNI